MGYCWWDESCRGRSWPSGGGFALYRPFWVTYWRTDDSDVLHIRVDRRVRKEDIKVRFIEPDRIEVEVQRRPAGEEIPIE